MDHPDTPELPGLAARPTDRLLFDIPVPSSLAPSIDRVRQSSAVAFRLWGKPISIERQSIALAHLGDYAGVPVQIVSKAIEAGKGVSFAPFNVRFDTLGEWVGARSHKPIVLKAHDREAAAFYALQRSLFIAMAHSGLDRFVVSMRPFIRLLYDSRFVPDTQVQAITIPVSGFRLTRTGRETGAIEVLAEWKAQDGLAQPSW